MKKITVLLSVFILFAAMSLSTLAASGTNNGTVNGNSYSMNYSCTSTNAYNSISCATAQNVEARVKPYYKINGEWHWLCDWYAYYNEPGTIATVSWNAGTGRIIGKTMLQGYVNNVFAYGTTINAD